VAHACNPSYSGGRDEKDHSSKPTPGKQFVRPYQEKTHHKTVLVKWLKVEALSSNPRTTKRKKKKKTYALLLHRFLWNNLSV
jgi:hypothetical protein